ncbi:sensor histidine kinase [Bailinhaonella thermotolerans]|uniref:histidine kinase n=1 Tax=Bailinhaonella thermotolerans TaxID=1070861 RepID=A0A3A4B734_9ACTN|nr:histidine kinase [Bailinhaonella thermotolerans]RJL33314.1 two-component sensor histidine kinase [Bailinhaonella thermotolerans]
MGGWQRVALWARRLAEVALLGWLGLLTLLDLIGSVNMGASFVLVAAGDAVGILAVVRRRRAPERWASILIVVSIAISLVSKLSGLGSFAGVAEAGSIMMLVMAVTRVTYPTPRAIALALLALVALITGPALRIVDGYGSLALGNAEAFGSLYFIGWITACAIGFYLRYQEERRTVAMDVARRSERLDLARELHDLVAHHITGIVVQAQAARVVAERQPQAVIPALDAIAGAGAEALTSMRRLVGVLRDGDEAARTPGVSLADLRTMVDKFTASGVRAGLEIGPGITDADLHPEVLTTIHRVVQESLTNIRRHAPGASWVEVGLRRDGQTLTIRVANFGGTATDSRPFRLGGGFGLVGMAERVEALGGHLHAGPSPQGGWEVRAELPLRL